MTKSRSHDRRGLYAKGQLPPHAKYAAVEIEDPYADAAYIAPDGTADHAARLEQFQHPNGHVAEGAPGWTPPPRPTITVIRSLKDDPLGRMHSRHQIDQAEFLAGRAYQECFAAAQLTSPGSISDLGSAGVSGGGMRDPLTETRQRALRLLRALDQALAKQHGSEGVGLVRDVLGEGHSIEVAARRRASMSERTTRSWGWLFRRCLALIAFKLGYASTSNSRGR